MKPTRAPRSRNSAIRHGLTMVFVAAVTLSIRLGGAPPSAASVVHAPVEPDVLAALESVAAVHVLVVLESAEDAAPPPATLDRGATTIAATQQAVLSAVNDSAFRLTHRYRNIPALAGWATTEGVRTLAAHPAVWGVDLVREGAGGLDSSVPFIGADSAFATGVTGRGVRVAVVDSGVDTDHPDLAGRIVAQQCFVTTSSGCGAAPNVAEDDHGHGTNVTGIVASQGGVAPRGVAPGVDIVAVKVINDRNRYVTANLLAALDWLIDRDDIDIVNMSLGTFRPYSGVCDDADPTARAYADALTTLRDKGVISFVCTMNERSSQGIGAPACTSAAVSVGAVYDTPVDLADSVWPRSNSDVTLDLLGPGVGVRSTGRGGGVSSFSGTSQAAPHVTGLAALMLAVDPDLAPDDVVRILKDTGDPVLDERNGVTASRIDARAALTYLGVVLTPAPPTPTPTATSDRPTRDPNATPRATSTGAPSGTAKPTGTGTRSPNDTPVPTVTRTPSTNDTPVPTGTRTRSPNDTPVPTPTGPATQSPTPSAPSERLTVYLPLVIR